MPCCYLPGPRTRRWRPVATAPCRRHLPLEHDPGTVPVGGLFRVVFPDGNVPPEAPVNALARWIGAKDKIAIIVGKYEGKPALYINLE